MLEEMDEDRNESVGVPPHDSLELTPLLLLLLLRSATGDLDASNSPRLSKPLTSWDEADDEDDGEDDDEEVDEHDGEGLFTSTPAEPVLVEVFERLLVLDGDDAMEDAAEASPGNQLGKLLFSVSMRS